MGKKTTYGLLTIVSKMGNNKILCKCECGNTRIVSWSKLKDGTALNCGCADREFDKLYEEYNNTVNIGLSLSEFMKVSIAKRKKLDIIKEFCDNNYECGYEVNKDSFKDE